MKFRQWSPWHLRSLIKDLEEMLADERNDPTVDDRKNTFVERQYRYAVAGLDGMALNEAWVEATRFRVEDGKLIFTIVPYIRDVKKGMSPKQIARWQKKWWGMS